MLVFDTNVLIYVADKRSPFHHACRDRVFMARDDGFYAFVTWSICYEFVRVTTLRRGPRVPWTLKQDWTYIETLLGPLKFGILTATDRHKALLAKTVTELPNLHGNAAHYLHIAVLMREYGIDRICTRDADFRRFPFLTVVDPVAEARDG